MLKPEWRVAYNALADQFRFTDAKPHCKNSSDETTKFLQASQAAGILQHDPAIRPKGAYRKTVAATDAPKGDTATMATTPRNRFQTI